jgi:hypothetical protein
VFENFHIGADDLDEPLAGVDLVAEDLAKVTWLGAEYFLNDGRIAKPCKDGADAAACLRVCRNSGETQEIETNGWFIYRYQLKC